MDLIVMRHGKAEDSHSEGDHARELTAKGHQQAERQARRLAQAGLLPAIVLCSPLVRSRQTAETFCESVDISGPMIQSWLACGMTPETALSELTAYQDFGRVAIVGHEPDLSSLVAWLLAGHDQAIQMKKGSIALLWVQPPARRANLQLLLPARLGLGGE